MHILLYIIPAVIASLAVGLFVARITQISGQSERQAPPATTDGPPVTLRLPLTVLWIGIGDIAILLSTGIFFLAAFERPSRIAGRIVCGLLILLGLYLVILQRRWYLRFTPGADEFAYRPFCGRVRHLRFSACEGFRQKSTCLSLSVRDGRRRRICRIEQIAHGYSALLEELGRHGVRRMK